MYPPRRPKARAAAAAAPPAPAFHPSSSLAGAGVPDSLSLVGKKFEPSHKALTKAEKETLAYFTAGPEKRAVHFEQSRSSKPMRNEPLGTVSIPEESSHPPKLHEEVPDQIRKHKGGTLSKE